MDGSRDMMEHTVDVCLAWPELRRVHVAVIGGGDLSHPALVQSSARKGGDGERDKCSHASSIRIRPDRRQTSSNSGQL